MLHLILYLESKVGTYLRSTYYKLLLRYLDWKFPYVEAPKNWHYLGLSLKDIAEKNESIAEDRKEFLNKYWV